MASSVVRATVRAVSKRKIQATRAALTLVSAAPPQSGRAPRGPCCLTAAGAAPRAGPCRAAPPPSAPGLPPGLRQVARGQPGAAGRGEHGPPWAGAAGRGRAAPLSRGAGAGLGSAGEGCGEAEGSLTATTRPTPSAVQKIKQLLKDKPEHVGVKVGVRTRGCNGLSYTLEYTKSKGDSDEEVVQDGVRVFIEKKAQLTLLGTEMDYVEDKLSSEFVFNNPNIKGTCGCGESFNI
ncbi:iron-sulfur cluster assembly 1 homolog, mitochondrial isoform X1 [Strigops habroptila]|nr:iron-sulfur cluster assembly 1 homolog, mitochondrial isoform X1 [Strigops habroptila]